MFNEHMYLRQKMLASTKRDMAFTVGKQDTSYLSQIVRNK
jgi:hypothetical protein